MVDHEASSPGSLSSLSHSPEQGTPNSHVRPSTAGAGAGAGADAALGVAGASTPTPAATSPAPRGLTASGQPRKKPGPKPKIKDASLPDQEKKPRKPRKPAEPKDAYAAPAQRKRRTKASVDAQPAQIVDEPPPVQQSSAPQTKPSEPAPVLQPEPALAPAPAPAPVLAPVSVSVPVPVPVAAPTQQPRVPSNQEPNFQNNPSLSHITVAPSPPRPSSSGQRYDPIRGGLFEPKSQTPANVPPPISPPLNRASASPSITSLIDPPSASNSFYSHPVKLQQQPSVTSAPVSPAGIPNRLHVIHSASDVPPQPHQQPQTQLQPQPSPPQTFSTVLSGSTPMEIDSEPNVQASIPMAKTNSTNSGTPSRSNAPTPPPKVARPKEAPPPLPAGSGLLSGTPFGPVANTNGASDTEGTNIWLTFTLKGRDNVTINFAQEVEKKYGFAALHPRIAARRERQRQITAAGAALERAAGGTSNDEMSVDLSENESNVDMGGMDDDTSARENGSKKRRKRKQEDYDKEDDFIDDTELAWEQQALMAKDGFFVYSGPLVTEEKPAVERADGTVRRGRGRGRGGTVRGDAAGRGRGRGNGTSSRGGSAVRKPRVTKADRAMMEQEKYERENLAATIAAKQPSSNTLVGQASTA